MTTAKVAKAAAPKKTHPTYSVMTAEAVKALKERSGSSLPALTKYITTTYSIDVNKHALNKALRDGVSDGKLIKVKASYKLPASAKEAPKKKKAAPKAAAGTAAAPKKKTVKKAAAPAAAAKPKKAATTTKAKAPSKKAAAPATGPKKVIAKKTKSTAKSPAKKSKASK